MVNGLTDAITMKARLRNCFLVEVVMSEVIPLTVDQLKKIHDQGFVYIQTSPGYFQRFTIKDLHISKEDLEKIKRGEIK